jgi:hypothetical protein
MNFHYLWLLTPILYLWLTFTHHTTKIKGEKDWLFIISTGRAGSTTILDMVNFISPDIYIRGETHGMPNRLMDLQQHIENIPDKESGAYYSKYNVYWETFLPEYRQIMFKLLGYITDYRVKTVGFKFVSIKSLRRLEWLHMLFPNARFIINWRKDIKALERSIKNANFRALDIKYIENWSKSLHSWAESMPENQIFNLPLEDFSLEKFNELLHWLGYTGCEYLKLIHNNKGGMNVDPQLNIMKGVCKK